MNRLQKVFLAGLACLSSAQAADISILRFSDTFYALAPGPRGIHSVEMPGGNVVAANVQGEMAEVIMADGVNLITALPYGVAGRRIHHDMGKIEQVELGSRIAVVTAQHGTAIYYQAGDRLRGMRISDGFPLGVMIHRDVAVLKWGDKVSMYGAIQGQVFRLHVPLNGMNDIHLGENTVMSLWGRKSHGTMFHTLTNAGFHSTRLSYDAPGEGSARSGKNQWKRIKGAQGKLGVPFEAPQAMPEKAKASFFGNQPPKGAESGKFFED